MVPANDLVTPLVSRAQTCPLPTVRGRERHRPVVRKAAGSATVLAAAVIAASPPAAAEVVSPEVAPLPAWTSLKSFQMPAPIPLFGESLLPTGRWAAQVKLVAEPPVGATDPVAQRASSSSVSRFAVPMLVEEAEQDQGAVVDTVTGATYTSRGFASSLQGAIAKVAVSSSATVAVVGPLRTVEFCYPKCNVYGDVQVRVTAAPAVVAIAANGRGGYWTVNSLGEVSAEGTASLGAPVGITLRDPVTAMASTSDGKGYVIIDRSGQAYAYGDAPHLPNGAPMADAVGIAMDPGNKGYWVVSASGSVRAAGNAAHLGSLGGAAAKAGGIVGIAATPDGRGYWLSTSAGVVHGFGDAAVKGAPPKLSPVPGEFMTLAPGLVTGIVSSSKGGYMLVTSGAHLYEYGGGFAFYRSDMSSVGLLPRGEAIPSHLPPGVTDSAPGAGLLNGQPVVGLAVQDDGSSAAVIGAGGALNPAVFTVLPGGPPPAASGILTGRSSTGS